MDKRNFLGVNTVGVLKHASGKYLCWDNESGKWTLGELWQAHKVLGNKEFNANTIINIYRNSNKNDDSEITLEERLYVYMRQPDKSFFITEGMCKSIAWLYDYMSV